MQAKLSQLKYLGALFVLVLLATSNPAVADVYKWVDESGVEHYSTKPVHKEAKKADLPEIMRGEVKVPASALYSCKEHGGVDCQTGADQDGSVICYDGFRESAQRYRFICEAAKLEVSEVSPIESGKFTVTIRNSKPVKAEKVGVILKLEHAPNIKLDGPQEIDPFGIGDYKFELPAGGALPSTLPSKILPQQLVINCGNCPGM